MKGHQMMSRFVDVMFILIIIMSLGLAVYNLTTIASQRNYEVSVFYDCRIAEISPDVPPAVKQECRKKMEK